MNAPIELSDDSTAFRRDGERSPRLPVALIFLVLFAAVWFAALDMRALAKPDEGRYGEIGREMAVGSDWVTPRLNGIKYFEKPPLQYWATAVAIRALGPTPLAARLWPAVTGFAGILLVMFAGRRLYGRRAGWFAGLALGSNLYYFLLGHINTLDMGLCFFMSASLCAFLLARERRPGSGGRAWMWLAWLAAGCAVLSKGPVALVIPGATLALYSLIQRDLSVWRGLHPISGMCLLLLVVAPWFVSVSLANPEFASFFFIHEHLQRFTTTVHRRVQPFWFFAPVLLAGLLPWLGVALAAAGRSPHSGSRFSSRRFLLIWCAVVFLFFSVSQSKLPAYILPMFPAIALLAGGYLATQPVRPGLQVVVPGLLLALVFAAASGWFALHAAPPEDVEMHRSFAPWLALAAACSVLGTLLFALARRRRHAAVGWCAFALFSAIAVQLGLIGHNTFAPRHSAAAIAAQAGPLIAPEAPFYSVGMYDQTLDFYLGRTVTVVAFQDELEFGLTQEPQLWIPDMERFAGAWRAAKEAYAVMQPATFDALLRAGLPMRELARDGERVIVSRS